MQSLTDILQVITILLLVVHSWIMMKRIDILSDKLDGIEDEEDEDDDI